jgi:hypothetical protein
VRFFEEQANAKVHSLRLLLLGLTIAKATFAISGVALLIGFLDDCLQNEFEAQEIS